MRRTVLAVTALLLVSPGFPAAASAQADREAPAAESPAPPGAAQEADRPPPEEAAPGAQGEAAPETAAPEDGQPPADEAAAPSAPNGGPAADNQAAPPPASQAPAPDDQAAPPPPPGAPETKATPPARPPSYISMDFTDVDLPVLIKFISEQTRKNFIFDERVQGKITIISPRKITVEEAYNLFLSVLHVKGFATVEEDNTIKIVPMRDAKQESLPTVTDGSDAPGAKFITRLIPLQFVDVSEIVTILTPMISKDGLLTAFPTSNTLIVIDSRANIDRILKILADIDREGTGSSLRIFPLQYASAVEVAKTMDTLYQQVATPQAPGVRGRVLPGRTRGTVPKFLPDARTNSLLVLAVQDVLADVESLIRQLDVPSPPGTGKINVHYLENADAEEIAKVLASLAETAAAARQPGQQAQPATIRGVVSAELEGGVKVTPDKATNSLIVVASPTDYQTLIDVIKKLDIRRRQVYVEALVMEISLDKARDVGVEFRGAAEISNDGAALGGTNFGFQGNLNELLVSLASGNPLLFSGTGLIAAGIAGNVTLPDGTEVPAITAVLRAAQTRDNVNILSSPHLLTMDNKEAEIVVAENVPFITSQARDTTNLENIINTVERRDVGIILRITPHIHESEFVSMDIYQESSAVQGDSLLAVSTVGPTTTKRSAKTTVLVRNGDTVVIGGMMQETFNTQERKVPLLGSIPLLGNFFKFSSVTRSKTNLLIFLTPHVIRTPDDMSRVTGDHQRKMDEFIEQNRGEVERIFPERPAGENP